MQSPEHKVQYVNSYVKKDKKKKNDNSKTKGIGEGVKEYYKLK